MNSLSLAILILLNSLLFVSITQQSKECTLISNPILRLSSRRKRSLLLPNYGSVKVTVGIGKALIGNNPKGLSLSYEMCSYFAGPTVIKDLFNQIRQKKPKQEDIDEVSKSKNKKNMRLSDKSIQQGYTNLSGAYFSKPSGSSYKQFPFKVINLSHKSKNIQRLFERSSSRSEYVPSGMINIQRKSFLKMALDYLLGPDVMCGILKKICKSNDFLLPPGYSMIQDIVRIIVLMLKKDLKSGEENFNFCEEKLYSDCSDEKMPSN